MPKLTIDLREGFFHTPVTIRLDGKEVFRAGDVTTRTQTGLARQIDVAAPAGPATLEVELPGKQRFQQSIDAKNSPFIGLDLADDGSLKLRESEQPFGYV
jgi:hypothetical protein